MVDAFGQPYLFQHDLRLLTCLITILAAHDQRHGHVIQGRKLRQQMMELVHETQATVTQLATLLFRKRSEEHTSELQSLMRISYAVFCLKQKKTSHSINYHCTHQPKDTT